MADSWYVGLFGQGEHTEAPTECGRRTLTFLRALQQIDPCFHHFQYSRRVRGKVVSDDLALDLGKLTELFARGVNRRDSDRSVIEELGFSISVTIPGKRGAWLTINYGSYGPWTSNSCVLRPRSTDPEAARIITVPIFTQILRHMVEAFELDHGLATSRQYRDVVNEPFNPREELRVGWIMYFSRKWGAVPPLPTPVRIEPVGKQGNLIILTEDRASASIPEHLEIGRRVRRLLGKSGLLDRRNPKPETD